MKDWLIVTNEKYIKELAEENKNLQEKMNINLENINKYQRYNRELLGRDTA